MQRIAMTLLVATFLVSITLAEQPVPVDHSTVHVVFLVPDIDRVNGLHGGESSKPTASIGNMVLPLNSIRPVSISIDGDFVSHALFGLHEVEPVFVLPGGRHKFEFSCNGFMNTSLDVKVLGTGSKQYLIVHLKAAPNTADKATREP